MTDKYVILISVIAVFVAFPQTAVAVLILYRKWKSKRQQITIPSIQHGNSNTRVLTLWQQESGGNIWKIMEIIAVVCALLLLLFDGFLIHVMVTEQIPLPTDLASITFFILFIGIPLFIIITTVITLFHYWRTGLSWINALGEVVMEGETTEIFDKCQEALKPFKARITNIERKPYCIIAELEKDRIVIRLRRIRAKNHRIMLLSQCKSPIVIFDSGRNCKNVNKFIQELRRIK